MLKKITINTASSQYFLTSLLICGGGFLPASANDIETANNVIFIPPDLILKNSPPIQNPVSNINSFARAGTADASPDTGTADVSPDTGSTVSTPSTPSQSPPAGTPTSKIANIPGLTALQSTTGAAVQAVCKGLAPTNSLTNEAPSAEADLFNQCNAMVNTSNAIQGSGGTGNSLNLNSEELGGALQNIASEEMTTPSRISINSLSGQLAEINTHLFNLHKFSQGLGGSGGDEEGSLLSNKLSTFVNGFGDFGDIENSDRENASDFYSAGVIVGLDYRFNNNFVAGIAGSYSAQDIDFQKSINVSGGGIDADTYTVSIFSSYDLENFYLDGSFSYGWSDYDLRRSVVILSNNASSTGGANRLAISSPEGEQYSGGLGFGYNYNQAAFNLRPYARVQYYHGNIDDYTESGAFGLNQAVDEQNFESLQSILGTQLSYTASQSFGVIIPQINFGWHHEFLNNSRAINAHYIADFNKIPLSARTNAPDRDYFTLGAGLSTVLQGGTQLFFNYQSLLGYRDVNSHSFEAGVRIEF